MWEVLSLGTYSSLTRMQYIFASSTAQLKIAAALPSTVKDLTGAFAFSYFNSPLGSWNTSNVALMGSMFFYGYEFNQPLSSWDVSNVETMAKMFCETTKFNQDLSSWTPVKLQNAQEMFSWTDAFNNGDQTASAAVAGTKPLTWDTPSLSNTLQMFQKALKFNQDISTFDTALVTSFASMFEDAAFFNNGDPAGAYIGDTFSSNVSMPWTTSSVSSFANTFRAAVNFNQNLDSWDVRQGQGFTYMFSGNNSATPSSVMVGSSF